MENIVLTGHQRKQLEEIALIAYPSLCFSKALPLIISEVYKRRVLEPAMAEKRMRFVDAYRESKPVLSLH